MLGTPAAFDEHLRAQDLYPLCLLTHCRYLVLPVLLVACQFVSTALITPPKTEKEKEEENATTQVRSPTQQAAKRCRLAALNAVDNLRYIGVEPAQVLMLCKHTMNMAPSRTVMCVAQHSTLAHPTTSLPDMWSQRRNTVMPGIVSAQSTLTRCDRALQAVLKLLPLMIGWFALNLPSGLGLYYLSNTVLTTGQQVFLRKYSGASLGLQGIGCSLHAMPLAPVQVQHLHLLAFSLCHIQRYSYVSIEWGDAPS
jgi:60Kd inner membrane protein